MIRRLNALLGIFSGFRADRLVEVRGPHGDILYMSPNLSGPVLRDGIETFHTRHIAGRDVRIGVFRDQELTLT